jgi:hypothetical protein
MKEGRRDLRIQTVKSLSYKKENQKIWLIFDQARTKFMVLHGLLTIYLPTLVWHPSMMLHWLPSMPQTPTLPPVWGHTQAVLSGLLCHLLCSLTTFIPDPTVSTSSPREAFPLTLDAICFPCLNTQCPLQLLFHSCGHSYSYACPLVISPQ